MASPSDFAPPLEGLALAEALPAPPLEGLALADALPASTLGGLALAEALPAPPLEGLALADALPASTLGGLALAEALPAPPIEGEAPPIEGEAPTLKGLDPAEALPWAENHDVNSRVLPSLTPREQAIARTVCRLWNDTCVARPFIRAGELPIGELKENVVLSSMAWSPEGDLVGVGFNDGSVRAFCADEGHREVAMQNLCSPKSIAVHAIAFSAGAPADVLVAYSDHQSDDATLRVQPAAPAAAKTMSLPIRRNESVDHVAFAPGATAGRFSVACSVVDCDQFAYSAVYVWSNCARKPWKRVCYLRFSHDDLSVRSVHHCSFSNDGLKLAVTTSARGYDEEDLDADDEIPDNDTTRVYTLDTGVCLSVVAFEGTICCPSWSPDDEWLAAVSDEAPDGASCFAYVNRAGVASAHALAAGTGRYPRPGAACLAVGPLRSSAFLFCDGHAEFVVASGAAPVTKTFDPRALPPRDNGRPMRAALSPDGAAFAVVLDDGRVRIVRFH